MNIQTRYDLERADDEGGDDLDAITPHQAAEDLAAQKRATAIAAQKRKLIAERKEAAPRAAAKKRVVVGEHGWWQAAPEANAPGYDPFSRQGSNYNLTADPTARDPISGTTAHRSGRCEVSCIA